MHFQPNRSGMSFPVRELGENLTTLGFVDVVTMCGALAVVYH